MVDANMYPAVNYNKLKKNITIFKNCKWPLNHDVWQLIFNISYVKLPEGKHMET